MHDIHKFVDVFPITVCVCVNIYYELRTITLGESVYLRVCSRRVICIKESKMRTEDDIGIRAVNHVTYKTELNLLRRKYRVTSMNIYLIFFDEYSCNNPFAAAVDAPDCN